MNAREKYDSMISKIEELVKEHKKTTNQIIAEAFKAGEASFMTDKEKRAFFGFMVGKTINGYVERRRMMLVYEKLIHRDYWALKDLYKYAFAKEKGFIEKFERYFSMKPDVAFKLKDETKLEPPMFWNVISEDIRSTFEELEEESEKMTLKFGIKATPLQRIEANAAQNLENYYGLNDRESEFAFNLAKANSFSFDETFKYVYDYVWKYVEYPEIYKNNRDDRLETDLLDRKVLHLYFNNGMNFGEINDALMMIIDQEESGSWSSINLEKANKTACKKAIEYYKYGYSSEDLIQMNENSDEDEPYVDIDDLYSAAYGGDSDYMEAYSDGYEPNADDYEAGQDLYMGYDANDEISDVYDTVNSDYKIYNLDNMEEYEKCCHELDTKTYAYKGEIFSGLPLIYDDLDIEKNLRALRKSRIEEYFDLPEEEDDYGEWKFSVQKMIGSKMEMQHLLSIYIDCYAGNEKDDAWIERTKQKISNYYSLVIDYYNKKGDEIKITAEEIARKEKEWDEVQQANKKYIDDEKHRKEQIRADVMNNYKPGDKILHKNLNVCEIKTISNGVAELILYDGSIIKMNLVYSAEVGDIKKIDKK